MERLYQDGNMPHAQAYDLDTLLKAQLPDHALSGPFYTDPDLFALELGRLFYRDWLFAGHVSRIPTPGSYFTYRIADESLIIIHGDDGAIHAVFNVCRHKGSLLCLSECGTAKRLVCPYHQWVYATDGRLLAARHMPESFDREPYGLHRAHIHLYDGLIFVSLADAPPPFPDVNHAWFSPYRFAEAKVADIAVYDVKANWKVLVENFLECYHCGVVHPEYTRVMAGAASSYLSQEEIVTQAGRTSQEAREADMGLGFAEDRPAMQFRRGVCTQSLDGQPVAPLMGDHREYDGSAISAWIGWTLEIEGNPDHVAAFRFTPRTVDLTEIQVTWLVRCDAVESRDYDRERLTEFWKITGQQDWDICEIVQRGVRSHHYTPGPLSNGERGPKLFLREYLTRLAAASQ